MPLLLQVSRAIDALGLWIGQAMRWLILAAVLISAANAVVRKSFNFSSNAFLEVQWYLFAAVFMLGAGYVFLRNGHVRIDFIASRLSARTNAVIDIIGILVVVLPLTLMMLKLSWPLFDKAWVSGELSQNAGGLVRWPVLLMMPLGFGLLLLQAASELIKRAAFLSGHLPHPFSPEHPAHAGAEEARP